MASLRTSGRAFAEALDRGFVSLGRVVDWVDGKMRALEKPPIELVEACASHSAQAVVDALRSLPGDLDEEQFLRQCLWHAASALQRDDSIAEAIAAWVEPYAIEHDWMRSKEFYSFDDEFDLISAGVSARSRSDVVRALARMLCDHGERPNQPKEQPSRDQHNRES
jgi:hypothetical protein